MGFPVVSLVTSPYVRNIFKIILFEVNKIKTGSNSSPSAPDLGKKATEFPPFLLVLSHMWEEVSVD